MFQKDSNRGAVVSLNLILNCSINQQHVDTVQHYVIVNFECLVMQSIYFHKVRNGIIQNIKSVNPKGFHFFVTNCANIRLRLLKLTAPATSPNTDGIHISNSIDVKLSKNIIETGDDCVSMIQGVNNITINKLKCGPGHGIR